MSQGPEIQVPLATLRETEDTLSGVCTTISSFVFAKLIIKANVYSPKIAYIQQADRI